MKRRTLLRIAAPTLALGLAGCSDEGEDGDDGGGDGDSDADETINIVALDRSAEDLDDPITDLTVEYDARTEFLVNPDEAGMMEADGETVNLVLQFRVTNDGDEPIDVTPEMFQVANANDEGVYQRYDTDDPDQFPERTLAPGQVATGWIVYRIPASEAKVLLAVRQASLSGEATVTFEETDLEFTIEDEDSRTTVPEDA